MAEWADGREEHAIDGILTQLSCELRAAFGNQACGRNHRAHDAEMPRYRLANLTCANEFAKPLERQRQVSVRFDAGVVECVAALGNNILA